MTILVRCQVSLLLAQLIIGVIVGLFTEIKRLNSEHLYGWLTQFTGSAHSQERAAIEDDVLKLNTLMLPVNEALDLLVGNDKGDVKVITFDEGGKSSHIIFEILRKAAPEVNQSPLGKFDQELQMVEFVKKAVNRVDADLLLFEHAWIEKIGITHIQNKNVQTKSGLSTAVAEAEIAMKEAALEEAKANRATKMVEELQSALLVEMKNGDPSSISLATTRLSKAEAEAQRARLDARLAEADATTMEAWMQAAIAEKDYEVEEKNARAAEIAVRKAEIALTEAQWDGDELAIEMMQKILISAQEVAQKERDEAQVAEAVVRSKQVEAGIGRAVAHVEIERAQAKAANKRLAAATTALEFATKHGDCAALKQAEEEFVSAQAAAERESGEAKVAEAAVKVVNAEILADQAEKDALEEKADVHAAEAAVWRAESELTDAQRGGDPAAVAKANAALASAIANVKKERMEAAEAMEEWKAAESDLEDMEEEAQEVMDEVETRAAANTELSVDQEKSLNRYSLIAAIVIILAVFVIAFGASASIHTMANRVIDNDIMLAECQSQNYMKLVSKSLIQDMLDAVSRAAQMFAASTTSSSFSGTTISGSCPASLMGVMVSGNMSDCTRSALTRWVQVQALWEIRAACLPRGRSFALANR